MAKMEDGSMAASDLPLSRTHTPTVIVNMNVMRNRDAYLIVSHASRCHRRCSTFMTGLCVAAFPAASPSFFNALVSLIIITINLILSQEKPRLEHSFLLRD